MKTIKLAFTCCSFLLASSFAQAQEKPLIDAMVKHWETSKALTLAVAEAMPSESYDFKATSGEMSFGQQIYHIAKANALYCSVASGAKNPLAGPEFGAEDDSKASAEKAVTTAYDYCISNLRQTSEADLMKMVGKAPNQTTVFERFWGGFTHAAHHRGQAEVYLRLKGITPPTYKF